MENRLRTTSRKQQFCPSLIDENFSVNIKRFLRLDAPVPRHHLQSFYVQQWKQLFGNEEKITLHQADGNGGHDVLQDTNSSCIHKGLLAATLLLLRFEACIGLRVCFLGWCTGHVGSVQTFLSSPLSTPSATMASVVYLHVLNSGRFAFSGVSGFSSRTSVYLSRGKAGLPSFCIP